jgi:endoglucanase
MRDRGLMALLLGLALLGSCPAFAANDPLPDDVFHVVGNQIEDSSGNKVRIAALGYNEPSGDYSRDMAASRSIGFNTMRYPFFTADYKNDPAGFLANLDAIVSAAAANKMKVIFDNHGSEAGGGNCPGQQENGLPYDKNMTTPIGGIVYNATDNTNGCGNTGTVTLQDWLDTWTAIAGHFKGNTTVIGFDTVNEPTTYSNRIKSHGRPTTWGGRTASDMHEMDELAAAAIHAANPGALVIIEGLIAGSWFNFTMQDGVHTNPFHSYTDLSGVAKLPITNAQGKVVYSVHDYPQVANSNYLDATHRPDYGKRRINAWDWAFGYLITRNIAPVWIGEMGCNCDAAGRQSTVEDDNEWGRAITTYLNTTLPRANPGDQAPGGDWWTFGAFNPADQYTNGVFTDTTYVNAKPAQRQWFQTLLYQAAPAPSLAPSVGQIAPTHRP